MRKEKIEIATRISNSTTRDGVYLAEASTAFGTVKIVSVTYSASQERKEGMVEEYGFYGERIGGLTGPRAG